MADSNVSTPPDYLRRLLATWRADTGLVSSPAVGCTPANIWAELECAFLNTYQVRWQCFADSIGMGFAQGKTMLFRRALLERAGGIRALALEIAEDAAATKLVRKNDLRVRVVDRPFPQPLGHRTAAEVWQPRPQACRVLLMTPKGGAAAAGLAEPGLPPAGGAAIALVHEQAFKFHPVHPQQAGRRFPRLLRPSRAADAANRFDRGEGHDVH